MTKPSYPSLNTQSCIRRPLCSTLKFENLSISLFIIRFLRFFFIFSNIILSNFLVQTTGSFQSIEIGKKFSQTFDNVFHVYLMSVFQKNAKKKNFRDGLFFKSTLSVLRCRWTGRINLKIFFLTGNNSMFFQKPSYIVNTQTMQIHIYVFCRNARAVNTEGQGGGRATAPPPQCCQMELRWRFRDLSRMFQK